MIAGLPRTGTTHLHNLMSADPALRSLPWWEAMEPVPPPEEAGTTEGRIERAKAGLAVPAHRLAPLRPDARDDLGSRARGDPPAGHRLLHHAVRLHGPHAHLAVLLPVPRPDPPLPVPQAAPTGAHPPAASPGALGAQVPPAPRTDRPIDERVRRRHRGVHPPRPRLHHRFVRHHDLLLGPHERRPPGGHPPHRAVVGPTHRGHAPFLHQRP